MKLHILSDLHVEFAGDIHQRARQAWARQAFAGYTRGNPRVNERGRATPGIFIESGEEADS
ncbi:hypothetical protein [Polaromonas sp.]|uniref:hypothetical protein n=1 Tax=Polaromonas sp. TaxID=1869339 RepID=UPI003BB6F64D